MENKTDENVVGYIVYCYDDMEKNLENYVNFTQSQLKSRIIPVDLKEEFLKVFKDRNVLKITSTEIDKFLNDYCHTDSGFEENLKKAYEKYLELPLATLKDLSGELYQNDWYVTTGLGIVAPNPHRHYTFIEFCFHCGRDEKMWNRFKNQTT